MERWFQALNPHRGGGEMEGWHHYGRGSGGGAAREAEATLDMTIAGWTGNGGTTSDWRRETKEERAEWTAKAQWAGFRNGK
jgi:hypothetical protein